MSPCLRERFIPYRRTDVIAMCMHDQSLAADEQQAFADFYNILTSLFHFELHKTLEYLKDCYAPFNPDRDTRMFDSQDVKVESLPGKLERALTEVLKKANFERVTEEDLSQALNAESLFKVKLQVDFDDFEEVLFFRRGVQTREEDLRIWFGLRRQTVRLEVYDRVLVYVRFKDRTYFENTERKDLYFEPGSTIIKLFRNVPKNDLEMLFPNTEVRMKPLDKLIIGVPTAVGGIFMLVTKLGSTLILLFAVIAFWLGLRDQPAVIEQSTLVALGIGLAGLGGFLWRQFSKYKNRKIQFMKQLAENLYFKNLDNNAGVFHSLIDAAEEEECKESILAYYHLLKAGTALSEEALDQVIEQWFDTNFGCSLDFEMDDALAKLTRLQLVTEKSGKYRAVPLPAAKQRLDKIWDDYFQFGLEPSQ